MFVFSGWNNNYTFIRKYLSDNITPIENYPEKCKLVLQGFLRHSFTKTMMKYLGVLDKKDSFRVKELCKLLNHRQDSILDTIRKKHYRSFIEIKGKPFQLSITMEGRVFLEIVRKIPKVLNAVDSQVKENKDILERYLGVTNNDRTIAF